MQAPTGGNKRVGPGLKSNALVGVDASAFARFRATKAARVTDASEVTLLKCEA